ncbi:phosphoribosyltransferase family protein [Arthrobacter sp. PAMC25284]|uniref:phosphoribosyltransferase family protein n=1 Tax=Arthrobacter sp. PAMC25284 TaxID=2861279 RepID=UPI002158B3BC|nr:phosphoribosyltransferase family protein [Arthrobacter sp. PAMC25284]
MSIFEDRVDAGRRLGRRVAELRGQDVVVLGLPRGGVPVAYEVAAALDAPLDVIVVRKLGLPYQPELAMGAIGEGGGPGPGGSGARPLEGGRRRASGRRGP